MQKVVMRESSSAWSRRFVLLSSVSLIFQLGCAGSSNDGPGKLIPVTGKVTLNGEPLGQASLTFIPKDQTKGAGGFAGTMSDGTYEVMHPSSSKGIEAGTYAVRFSKFAMPDGSPIPEGKNATDVGARESLPLMLSNPPLDRATHVVTVKDGTTNTFNFDLKAPKR